jgi:hypothetical protein
MEVRGRRLFVLVSALLGATAIVLAADPGTRADRPTGRSFQQLVGGLGGGPAVDLAGCPAGLDSRLDGRCSAGLGPVPGGSCWCGRHTGLLARPATVGASHPPPD